MQYHISKDGTQIGPFSEGEVRQKLAGGEIAGSDLAWHEGLPEWQALSSLLREPASGAPPIPSSAPVPPPLFQGVSPMPAAQPSASGLAIGSMICGLLGLIIFITSLPAVIMGHIALSRIKTSGGTIGGRGMAVTGLITGYMILALFPIAIIASLAIPTYNLITAQANQMKAATNCRQIQGMLLAYAADHNGQYPDSVTNPATGSVPLTSNDVFRVLFQEGLTQEEKIFGSPSSKFVPDGNIGVAPNYEEALKPGENHWAMTAGLTSDSPGLMPVVFENPAEASWPPRWDASAGGRPKRGRAWAGGKIVICRNDASVETVKLTASTGVVPARPSPAGVDPFSVDDKEHKVLDIAP
ncbi:MAG: DUF4190 domain-containing protein [Prosthecobacter sp.]|nr:DUF4190 domain-containing protein [Prosthecobacter sp.]